MENHQVPYSVVKEHYELVLDKLNSIDEDQTDLVNTLSDLRSQEKAIRDGLDVFELDLRNMKRTIEIPLTRSSKRVLRIVLCNKQSYRTIVAKDEPCEIRYD